MNAIVAIAMVVCGLSACTHKRQDEILMSQDFTAKQTRLPDFFNPGIEK